MSRTDTHRPYFAQDRANFLEYHDHSTKPCDLIEFSEFVKLGDNFLRLKNSCGYSLKFSFLREHPICGCHRCKDKVAKKIKNRKERYNKKYYSDN